jgi:hypothetical protein
MVSEVEAEAETQAAPEEPAAALIDADPARAAPDAETLQDPPEDGVKRSADSSEPAVDGGVESPIIRRLQETEEV